MSLVSENSGLLPMSGGIFSSIAPLRKLLTEHPCLWECTVKNPSLFSRRLDLEGTAPGPRLAQGEELTSYVGEDGFACVRVGVETVRTYTFSLTLLNNTEVFVFYFWIFFCGYATEENKICTRFLVELFIA